MIDCEPLRIGSCTPLENAVSEADRNGLAVLDGVRHLSVLRLWQEEGEDAGREGRHAEDDDGKRGVDDLSNKKTRRKCPSKPSAPMIQRNIYECFKCFWQNLSIN